MIGYAPLVEGEVVSPDGTIRYFKNGRIHSEDAPAIIYVTGERRWFRRGINVNRHGIARVKVKGDFVFRYNPIMKRVHMKVLT